MNCKLLAAAAGLLLVSQLPLSAGPGKSFRMDPDRDPTEPVEDVRTPESLATIVPVKRVVLRGWEIESVRAIKRPLLTQVFPDYQGGQRRGDRQLDLAAKKGAFLVVEVRVKWATDQPPTEPLWEGKPDAVLVDQQGVESPVEDVVIRKGNVFYVAGMVTGRGPSEERPRPRKQSRILLSFDVDALSGSFWFQPSPNGPRLQVDNVPDLPEVVEAVRGALP
jgi:hypothetical protein